MRTALKALTILVLGLVACSPQGPDQITLIAHDSFVGGVNENTFAAFTAETGVEVEVIAARDAGSLINQAVLTKDNPLADVLFGVDDTFLSRAIDEGIFTPYESPLLTEIQPELMVDGGLVTPIDFGDVCINYDKETIGDDVPTRLEDLRVPERASLLVVQHPASSSPGLAFMLATIDHFGEPGWLDFWRDLRDGGVRVTPDWDTAYNADFTRYGGDRPMVVSYASSPPAEVIYATEPLTEAPTGVVEAGCYRQVEYAGILSGTEHPETAGKLIDFMLSTGFQETIPLTWFVFPASQNASLPQEFVDHTSVPASPHRLDPDVIAENRDLWIDQWIEVMERGG